MVTERLSTETAKRVKAGDQLLFGEIPVAVVGTWVGQNGAVGVAVRPLAGGGGTFMVPPDELVREVA